MWQSRASPTSPILASPFGLPPAKCAQWQPLPGGLLLQPRRLLCSQFPPFCPVSHKPARPGRYGATASPARCDSRRCRRKQAAKLWHKARRWDRDTRQPGRHGGVIGRTALGTLYVLLFDFLNHRTGRLDPSLDAIARKAGCCRRAVVDALARLRDLGLLHWQRRCEETRDAEGRFRLRQRTNAYGLLPPSQWRGYRDTDPPPPDPATLGAPERDSRPDRGRGRRDHQGQRKAAVAALEADPRDRLAMALAALGRAMGAI